jgi:nucleoside 2-deoxyribosyltransferase
MHFGEIFRLCVQGVVECDALVAVLDGADADSGTAFEVGYAHALGKPIVGVRTDYRPQQERGTNLMLARACRAFVRRPAFDENLDGLVAELARKLARLLAR